MAVIALSRVYICQGRGVCGEHGGVNRSTATTIKSNDSVSSLSSSASAQKLAKALSSLHHFVVTTERAYIFVVPNVSKSFSVFLNDARSFFGSTVSLLLPLVGNATIIVSGLTLPIFKIKKFFGHHDATSATVTEQSLKPKSIAVTFNVEKTAFGSSKESSDILVDIPPHLRLLNLYRSAYTPADSNIQVWFTRERNIIK